MDDVRKFTRLLFMNLRIRQPDSFDHLQLQRSANRNSETPSFQVLRPRCLNDYHTACACVPYALRLRLHSAPCCWLRDVMQMHSEAIRKFHVLTFWLIIWPSKEEGICNVIGERLQDLGTDQGKCRAPITKQDTTVINLPYHELTLGAPLYQNPFELCIPLGRGWLWIFKMKSHYASHSSFELEVGALHQ